MSWLVDAIAMHMHGKSLGVQMCSLQVLDDCLKKKADGATLRCAHIF